MRFTTTGLLVSISPHYSNTVWIFDGLTVNSDVLQLVAHRHICRFGIGSDLGWKLGSCNRSRLALGNPSTGQEFHGCGSQSTDAPSDRLRCRSKQSAIVHFYLDLAVNVSDPTEADDGMAHVETGAYVTGRQNRRVLNHRAAIHKRVALEIAGASDNGGLTYLGACSDIGRSNDASLAFDTRAGSRPDSRADLAAHRPDGIFFGECIYDQLAEVRRVLQ